ncbi:MAG: hypothetical protein Q9221_004173 [Calogaya cf. arnoldii]
MTILYKDVVTEDEFLSDSWTKKLVANTVYEVDCKRIDNINEDELDDAPQTTIDLVNMFRLESLQFDPETFSSHLKTYTKTATEKLAERGMDEAEALEVKERIMGYWKAVVKPDIGKYEFTLGSPTTPGGPRMPMAWWCC